jgi:UDP-N-acetylglucosamine 2-epimerase (non-hydrolysing)
MIKMAPLVAELRRRKAEFLIIHTGQHYSPSLEELFYAQLEMPSPAYNLAVGSGAPGQQVARIISRIEKVLSSEKPDLVLVEGDTNSVLAAALAAVKQGIKVGHLEAGLRSYDSIPEELNRRLTDHCSEYLFAPTEKARETLTGEGINSGKIWITGNTIVDAVRQNIGAAERNHILRSLNLQPGKYFLATVHRQENVDDPDRFAAILSALDSLSLHYEMPVVYPAHPRSRQKIKSAKIDTRGIVLSEPLDYWAFLQLEKNARLVLTDSGGVQEEACILGTPCVTLRESTERPETVEIGANQLAGADPRKILACTQRMLKRKPAWEQPFGNGRAAARVAAIIAQA